MFAMQTMCRASEGSKIVENKNNIFFSFLAWGGWIVLKKNMIFFLYQKIPLVFSLVTTSYFNFFSRDVHLKVLASEAVQIIGIANISKLLRILYQKSVNLEYNTLVRLADGTNELTTKRLMFQVFFFS